MAAAGLQLSKIYIVRPRASNARYEDIRVADLDLVGRVMWHMRKMCGKVR